MGDMVVALLMGMATTSLFSACSSSDDSNSSEQVTPDASLSPSRTVLVYMVAENSLYGSVAPDVSELLNGVQQAHLYDGDRIVLYIDALSLPALYVLDNKTTATSLSELTPVLQYDSDVNSASSASLASVIANVKTNYPADSYGLVLWSHGSGWIPSDNATSSNAAKRRRSFGMDNGKNTNADTGPQINIDDLAAVLEQSGGFEYVFFDACFMQCIEVAYELRNATRYVISSPAEIPGPGAYYTTMVSALFKTDDCADAILRAYYDHYTSNKNYGILISSVNTSTLSDFAAYMKTVLTTHYEEILTANYNNVANNYFCYGATIYGRWGFSHPDFIDLLTVVRPVLDDDAYEALRQAMSSVVTCLHTDTWYSAFNDRHNSIDDSQCCGVSMFVPFAKYDTSSRQYSNTYFDTQWAKDVWVEAVAEAEAAKGSTDNDGNNEAGEDEPTTGSDTND